MDEWKNGWMNWWMDEWMNGWMGKWMNGWKDEWVNGWMKEWMDEWMNGWMGEWMSGWMDEWMNGWVDEWMSGWAPNMINVCSRLMCSVYNPRTNLNYITFYLPFCRLEWSAFLGEGRWDNIRGGGGEGYMHIRGGGKVRRDTAICIWFVDQSTTQ